MVQEVFRTLHEHGYIIEKTQLSAFSPVDRPHAARPLRRGHLPDLRLRRARGDQCDNCGNQLDPVELINPRSKINGETPEFRETEHFFLDLPAFDERCSSGSRAGATGGRTC